ncbi:MAG: class I SAM-dependent methyltransferase, partial [Parvularculaceae bacterium]
MRTDILELQAFYASPLGICARDFIVARALDAWPSLKGLRLAAFGYGEPYLEAIDAAAGPERALALDPDGQGVASWDSVAGDPATGRARNRAALVAEHHWPLPDASIDRLLIVHGLEETAKPLRLMREAWRVLTNDGRLIVVSAHRRGLWSLIETTPFANGRPYFVGQLERLFQESMFRPERRASALYFPPTRGAGTLRWARALERAGARLWPWAGGVVMLEAAKDLSQPVAARARAPRLIGAPAPTRAAVI